MPTSADSKRQDMIALIPQKTSFRSYEHDPKELPKWDSHYQI